MQRSRWKRPAPRLAHGLAGNPYQQPGAASIELPGLRFDQQGIVGPGGHCQLPEGRQAVTLLHSHEGVVPLAQGSPAADAGPVAWLRIRFPRASLVRRIELHLVAKFDVVAVGAEQRVAEAVQQIENRRAGGVGGAADLGQLLQELAALFVLVLVQFEYRQVDEEGPAVVGLRTVDRDVERVDQLAALADVLVVIDNPAVALDVGGIEAEAVGGRTAFAGTGGDGDLALSAARIVEQAAVATGAEAGFLVAARQKVAIAFLLAKIAEVGRDQLDRQGFALFDGGRRVASGR